MSFYIKPPNSTEEGSPWTAFRVGLRTSQRVEI